MDNDQSQKLLNIFQMLDSAGRENLLEFAQFLVQKRSRTVESLEVAGVEVHVEQRPDEESIVGAIKRLTRSYPMLDKRKLLSEVSGIMDQYILDNSNPVRAIDQLESLYERYYVEWKDMTSRDD